MFLLLMRHGEAEGPTKDDFNRRLTRHGEKLVINACELLRDDYLNRGGTEPLMVERVISSPLVRAQQTARIAAQLLLPVPDVETWDEVAPSGKCGVLSRKLEATSLSVVLVVSHQPFVSMFVEYLTGVSVSMDTATIAAIRSEVLQPESGELEWLIKV